MMNFLDSTPEVKPCPKCGANPYSHEPAPNAIKCRCSKCGFEGPVVSSDFDYMPGARKLEKLAVEQWNDMDAHSVKND